MRKLVGPLAVFFLASTLALAAPQLSPHFEVTTVYTGLNQPKGIDAVRHDAGPAMFDNWLWVAESGANQIVKLNHEGTLVVPFLATLGSFPVGVECYGGAYSQHMFVGGAISGGVERIAPDGTTIPFALAGIPIAEVDFGVTPAFGDFMYAGDWVTGDIYKVDALGVATLFATVPGEARYLKFPPPGSPFGDYLYVTDFGSGDIHRIDPAGGVQYFATTTEIGLEGFTFSEGYGFGEFLYTGNLWTGTIHRIAPDGTVVQWAEGFPGVADIIFFYHKDGKATMFFVDGQANGSVYYIRRVS